MSKTNFMLRIHEVPDITQLFLYNSWNLDYFNHYRAEATGPLALIILPFGYVCKFWGLQLTSGRHLKKYLAIGLENANIVIPALYFSKVKFRLFQKTSFCHTYNLESSTI